MRYTSCIMVDLPARGPAGDGVKGSLETKQNRLKRIITMVR